MGQHIVFLSMRGKSDYDTKKQYGKDLWFYDEDAHQIVVAAPMVLTFTIMLIKTII